MRIRTEPCFLVLLLRFGAPRQQTSLRLSVKGRTRPARRKPSKSPRTSANRSRSNEQRSHRGDRARSGNIRGGKLVSQFTIVPSLRSTDRAPRRVPLHQGCGNRSAFERSITHCGNTGDPCGGLPSVIAQWSIQPDPSSPTKVSGRPYA
jgi:hypothetical protein